MNAQLINQPSEYDIFCETYKSNIQEIISTAAAPTEAYQRLLGLSKDFDGDVRQIPAYEACRKLKISSDEYRREITIGQHGRYVVISFSECDADVSACYSMSEYNNGEWRQFSENIKMKMSWENARVTLNSWVS